jgi:hypothetical protein
LIKSHVKLKKNAVAKEEFYTSLEKVCDAVRHDSSNKGLNAKLEKSPIYIQHLEGTVFTTTKMMVEKER